MNNFWKNCCGIEKAIIVCLVVMVVGFAIGITYDFTRETFSLRRDQWNCTQVHQESQTTFIMVGKVMVPVNNIENVCDNWKRNS